MIYAILIASAIVGSAVVMFVLGACKLAARADAEHDAMVQRMLDGRDPRVSRDEGPWA